MEENAVCNYKAKKCLKCGAMTNPNDEKEFFCSQCGAPVVNKCSDYQCEQILDEKAKYCKYCGSSSLFNNYGLLDNSHSPMNIDELPF